MSEAQSKISFPIVAGAATFVLILGVGAGRVLIGDKPLNSSESTSARPAASASAERFKIPVTDTQPSRGPVDALVTVIEFCDLRSDACRRNDAAMQALMKEHEGRIRWVHRSFVEPTRPEQSHRMHAFGRAAFQHADKFWEMREQFLATPADVALSEKDYARMAHQVGLDYDSLKKAVDNGQFDGAVSFDAAFAIKFGVVNGFGLFVNGRRVMTHSGDDLKAFLHGVISEELAAAQKLIDQGITPDKVYAEIVKDGRWGVSEQDELARKAQLPAHR